MKTLPSTVSQSYSQNPNVPPILTHQKSRAFPKNWPLACAFHQPPSFSKGTCRPSLQGLCHDTILPYCKTSAPWMMDFLQPPTDPKLAHLLLLPAWTQEEGPEWDIFPHCAQPPTPGPVPSPEDICCTESGREKSGKRNMIL